MDILSFIIGIILIFTGKKMKEGGKITKKGKSILNIGIFLASFGAVFFVIGFARGFIKSFTSVVK